jgi:hypothetical protein
MEIPLLILAAVGFAAVVRRLLWSIFRAARHGAYVLYAREIAATRARRGDLTGLEEAREWAVRARRERLRALGEASLWLALLIIPLSFMSRPLPAFWIYSAIWLIPLSLPGGRPPAKSSRTTGGK